LYWFALHYVKVSGELLNRSAKGGMLNYVGEGVRLATVNWGRTCVGGAIITVNPGRRRRASGVWRPGTVLLDSQLI